MVDSDFSFLDMPTLAVTVIVGATVLVLVYISSLFRSTEPEETKTSAAPSATSRREKQEKNQQQRSDKSGKKKEHPEKWSSRDSKQFSHPWLLTSLKGHTGQILDMDFSSNGKFLATCADDRTILLWNTRDWTQKEHKRVRVNVDLDHATLVRWSPDSKAFVARRAGDNVLEVYRVSRRPDGLLGSVTRANTFPKMHEEAIVGLGVACTGRFMLTCSEGTDLLVSDIKGQPLGRVDTYLMHTRSARISPCGRFIAASGFTTDVKVWEVVFSKSGDFHSISRVYELSGHTSGVYDMAFNADSTRIGTVSKDGTWRLYDTNIEYKQGEDPHLLMSQKYPNQSTSLPACIALSPSGDVLAVGSGKHLHLYITRTGELHRTIENVYSSYISVVVFDASGRMVLTAGEKHVRVFHNVTGQYELSVNLKARLNTTNSSAQLERMRQQIADAEAFLHSIGESS